MKKRMAKIAYKGIVAMKKQQIDEILSEMHMLIQAKADKAFPEFGFRRCSSGWIATAWWSGS